MLSVTNSNYTYSSFIYTLFPFFPLANSPIQMKYTLWLNTRSDITNGALTNQLAAHITSFLS